MRMYSDVFLCMYSYVTVIVVGLPIQFEVVCESRCIARLSNDSLSSTVCICVCALTNCVENSHGRSVDSTTGVESTDSFSGI